MRRLLAMSITDEVRTQNAPMLLRRALTNRRNGELAWLFVADHWDTINERFPSNSIARLLEGVRSLSEPVGRTAGLRLLRDPRGAPGREDPRPAPRAARGQRGAAGPGVGPVRRAPPRPPPPAPPPPRLSRSERPTDGSRLDRDGDLARRAVPPGCHLRRERRQLLAVLRGRRGTSSCACSTTTGDRDAAPASPRSPRSSTTATSPASSPVSATASACTGPGPRAGHPVQPGTSC